MSNEKRGSMQTPTRFLAGAIGLLAVALVACGGDDDSNGATPTPGANGTAAPGTEVLLSSAPRTGPDQAAMAGTSAALDQFGFDLYEILAREDGNIVYSPYSAAIALAMTRAGALAKRWNRWTPCSTRMWLAISTQA